VQNRQKAAKHFVWHYTDQALIDSYSNLKQAVLLDQSGFKHPEQSKTGLARYN